MSIQLENVCTMLVMCLQIYLFAIPVFLVLFGITSLYSIIEYKREFNKRCPGEPICQYCAYWSIRKESCMLDENLQKKYSIEKKIRRKG